MSSPQRPLRSTATRSLPTRPLTRWNPETVSAGDVVGIGIHTGNAVDGYRIGKQARARGAYVVYGGIHATLFPDEAMKLGEAHAIVKGDGDLVWAQVIDDCERNAPKPDVRRRQGRRRRLQAGALVADSARQVHVGVGADRPRLPEALLVLLGVEDRRPAAAAASRRRGDRRDRRPAAPRVPLHRAGRRQLLSGHARRSRQGGAAGRQDPSTKS